MRKLIDLTHTIIDRMPVYPGDEETSLRQTRKLGEAGYNNHKLEICLHTGTHMDASMHLTDRNEFISQLPLENFIGEGCVLDARGESVIKMKREYEDKIGEKSIVLLYTGQDKYFGTEEYFCNNPVVDFGLANFLIDKKVKMLGIDTPSPDRYPFEVHKLLFKNGILIIENLTNVGRLLEEGRFEVIALPLKINADSSILRVVARVYDSD